MELGANESYRALLEMLKNKPANEALYLVLHPNEIAYLKEKGWCPDYAIASEELPIDKEIS